ncbi:uncharacterized protein [Leptinotarsa decemlineata]|uniref:uncharacterized protein n=1 Tax=Leptinotarsa decemlineata TaxID=7539 RepID=UPI003D3070E0
MAFPKLLVVVSALLLIQAQAQPRMEDNDPLITLILKLVKVTETVIDGILEETRNIAKEASENTEELRLKTLEVVRKAVDTIWSIIDGELARIKARGDDYINKAIDCIDGSKPESKLLILQLYNETTKCIAIQAKDVLELSVKLLNTLEDVKKDAFLMADQVKDCGELKTKEIECIVSVAATITYYLASAERYYKEQIYQFEEEFHKLAHDIYPTCIVPNAEIYREKSIKRLHNLVACIRS